MFDEEIPGSTSFINKLFNKLNLKIPSPIGAIVILLACIGFYLRIYNNSFLSFWNDEAICIYAASGITKFGVPKLLSGDIYYKAPLFTYSLAFIFKIFGIHETTARVLSAFYGVATIVLIYLFGKRLANRYVGLLAAFIMTFSIWAILWSREARFYQQFQFFSLLTFYSFYLGFIEKNIFENNKCKKTNKYQYLTLIALVCSIFTFKMAILLLPILLIILIVIYKWKVLKQKRVWIGSIFIMGIFVIYQLSPLLFSFTTRNPPFEFIRIGLNSDASAYNQIRYLIQVYPIMIILFFTGIFLLIFLKNVRKKSIFKKYLFLYIIFSLSLITIIFGIVWLQSSRYIYFLYPILILISCITIYELWVIIHDKLKGSIRMYTQIGFLCLVIGLIVFIDMGAQYSYSVTSQPTVNYEITDHWNGPFHPDHKNACEFIQEYIQSGDIIIARDELSTEYYFRGIPPNKDFEGYEIKKGGNLSEIQELFESNNVWVIINFALKKNVFPDDVLEFIKQNTEVVYETPDDMIKVRLESDSLNRFL